jgi:phenylalanine-4-hydroxylase
MKFGSRISYFRQYAATNLRPFTARYDAYTQRIELLDSKIQILRNMRLVNRELSTLTDALEKL